MLNFLAMHLNSYRGPYSSLDMDIYHLNWSLKSIFPTSIISSFSTLIRQFEEDLNDKNKAIKDNNKCYLEVWRGLHWQEPAERATEGRAWIFPAANGSKLCPRFARRPRRECCFRLTRKFLLRRRPMKKDYMLQEKSIYSKCRYRKRVDN